MSAPALSATLTEQPFDVAFHPSRPLVAAGVISGSVDVFTFTSAACGAVQSRAAHDECCRAVRFHLGGELLVSGGADRKLVLHNVERAKAVATLADAHDAAINRIEVVSDTLLASGDDDGHVRLWDVRTRARVATFRVHEDFVADMHVHRGRSALLTASGDGTLAHLDLRTQTVVARSDAQEDELLCVTLVKGGSKVVCGSQEGVLSIFDLADIQDISDRFPGHLASVDTLVAVTEDMVLTGSSDGVIRVISILPNKMLGIVGEHSDWPVERLALSADGNTVASASHDNTVKLWDIAYLREEDGEEGEEEEKQPAARRGAGSGDEDDSDDDDGSGKRTQKKRRRKSAAASQGGTAAGGKKAAKANFFKGLGE